MRNLLILSPHFPPTDAVDMHRVRMGVSHYEALGWSPTVLALEPAGVGFGITPELTDTVPPGLTLRRVGALPLRFTFRFGLTSVAFRGGLPLWRRGADLLRERPFDLVFISTTVFPLMTLGRLWKDQLGVPFVLDFQDPWATDYRGEGVRDLVGAKHSLMRALHRRLERWTLLECDGLIAVSGGYVNALRRRYPVLEHVPAATIPFGFLPRDFDVARRVEVPPVLAEQLATKVCGVYVGRLGSDMRGALRTLFEAFRVCLERDPIRFKQVRLVFLGTSYSTDGRGRPTALAVAKELGLDKYVIEQVERVPYFQALRALQVADVLLLPTSDDPDYQPSKLYPYLFAEKPLVAALEKDSALWKILDGLSTVGAQPFNGVGGCAARAPHLAESWGRLLRTSESLDFSEQRRRLEPFLAERTAALECELFERVVAGRRR